MAEQLFSDEDNKWLNDLMGTLGDGPVSNIDDTPATQQFSTEIDIDLESLTQEEEAKIAVMGIYFWIYYNPSTSLNTPTNDEELDKEALKMMRTLAYFKEYGIFQEEKERVRVGDRFPDISVKDANFTSRVALKRMKLELENPLTGEARRQLNFSMQPIFQHTMAVSKRAMEMEDRRMGRK